MSKYCNKICHKDSQEVLIDWMPIQTSVLMLWLLQLMKASVLDYIKQLKSTVYIENYKLTKLSITSLSTMLTNTFYTKITYVTSSVSAMNYVNEG